MRVSLEFKRRARTFGIGAACGFIAGAMLVGVLVWKYGTAIGVPSTRAAQPTTIAASPDGLADVDAPNATIGPAPAPDHDATLTSVPPADLTARHLEVPVEGVRRDQLVRTFMERRSGIRLHEAIDILAPRNTPVKAVEDGTVARLFLSMAGGITLYQFDPSEAYCYYYAHLERYADGLKEGDHVKKGQILGYVGTSGNAPKETPHLHFAVFRLTDARRWWEGTPIDPYGILR